MRKSLIIYALLLPFLIASSARIAAAVSEAGSSSPWNNPVATAGEAFAANDNSVSTDKLFSDAPHFDLVAVRIVAKLGLAHGSGKDTDRSVHPPRFLLNQSFLI